MAFLSPTTSGRLVVLVVVLVGLLEAEVVGRMLLTVSSRAGFVAIDYWVLASAGRVVAGGRVAYDHAALVRSMLQLSPLGDATHPGGGFAYAPWVAVALAPFGRVSYWAGLIVWTAISVVSLVWSIGRWWAWLKPPINRRWLTLATLVSYPVASGLRLGQTDAILLGLVTISFAAFRSNHWFWVGAVAVVAASAKPQDLLWLPIGYLLLTYGRRVELRRFLGGSAGMGLLLRTGPVLLNHRAWDGYLQSLMSISRFQPDWASISGLMRWVPLFNSDPGGIHSPFADAIFIAGISLIAVWVHRVLKTADSAFWSPTTRWAALAGYPLVVWLACVPYLHTEDLVLVLPFVIWGLAADPSALRRPALWVLLGGLEVANGVQALLIQVLPPTASFTPAVLGLAVLVGGFWVSSFLRASAPRPGTTAGGLSTPLLGRGPQ